MKRLFLSLLLLAASLGSVAQRISPSAKSASVPVGGTLGAPEYEAPSTGFADAINADSTVPTSVI